MILPWLFGRRLPRPVVAATLAAAAASAPSPEPAAAAAPAAPTELATAPSPPPDVSPPPSASLPPSAAPQPDRPEAILALYERYPSLRRVEALDRTSARRAVLSLIPKGGVGAELGVFTGAFSAVLYEVTEPARLHLVDVWHLLYETHYPSWGAYTDHGQLSIEAALAAVDARVAMMEGRAERIVSPSVAWLESLEPASLDWAYVDTSHNYKDTLAELAALDRVLKPDGLVLGDDCQIDPQHRHHGVFRAVRDFTRERRFEIIHLDRARQWAIRRSAATAAG